MYIGSEVTLVQKKFGQVIEISLRVNCNLFLEIILEGGSTCLDQDAGIQTRYDRV